MFVLPDAEPVDYSVMLTCGESEAGKLPITFEVGETVQKVRYAVFEGKIGSADMVSKLEYVKNGTGSDIKVLEKTADKEISGEYMFEFPKTSFYTIIACTYDQSGKYQEYTSAQFGYDTTSDPKAVILTAGLIVSDKHAVSGKTSENSMEFYVYGQNISEARIALYKTANYNDYTEDITTEIREYIEPLGIAQLDSLMLSGSIDNLIKCTIATQHNDFYRFICIFYQLSGNLDCMACVLCFMKYIRHFTTIQLLS
jgi:hypothetical protein